MEDVAVVVVDCEAEGAPLNLKVNLKSSICVDYDLRIVYGGNLRV